MEAFVKYNNNNGHTSECDTVLNAAPWVEILQKALILVTTFKVQCPSYLRFAKDLDAQCIAERVDTN